MHGLVLLDGSGNVLRPAILWNDQRTQAQCDEIHRRIGREKFIQISGNVSLTGFTASKILWVAENEPEVYARARHVLLPKDYISYRLTGEFAMDKADGSGTALFDLKKRQWSMELLAALEIPFGWMPPPLEGPEFRRITAAPAWNGPGEGTPSPRARDSSAGVALARSTWHVATVAPRRFRRDAFRAIEPNGLQMPFVML